MILHINNSEYDYHTLVKVAEMAGLAGLVGFHESEDGLVLRSTKHICNVPVHHRAREEGSSGYTLRKLLNLWMNGFTSFSVKPLRIATYFGTLFAAAGIVYLIYIVIDHFTRGAAPMGWASTTALLLLLGGMILVVLGIIGEYVGRIYMCANAAPQYVEREVIRHGEDNA